MVIALARRGTSLHQVLASGRQIFHRILPVTRRRKLSPQGQYLTRQFREMDRVRAKRTSAKAGM